MKIIKRPAGRAFSTLKAADTFFLANNRDSGIYMKIAAPSNVQDTAVNLETGALAVIEKDCPIVRMDTELVVEI